MQTNESKIHATEHIPQAVFRSTLQNRGQRFLLKTWHDSRKQPKARVATNLVITNEARLYESINQLANHGGSMFSPAHKEGGEVGETASFDGAEFPFKNFVTT